VIFNQKYDTVKTAILKRYRYRTVPCCTVPFRSVTVTSGKDNVNLDLVLGRGIFY
jgi:hypothetical protein